MSLLARDYDAMLEHYKSFSFDKVWTHHLILEIVADRNKDLLGLEALLVGVEDESIEAAMKCMRLFGQLYGSIAWVLTDEVLQEAEHRVAMAIKRLPSLEMLRDADAFAFAM